MIDLETTPVCCGTMLRMLSANVLARTSPILGLLLCVCLAPIIAHAGALGDGNGEAGWVASLSDLHGWAKDVAPGGNVYRAFGLVTPLVYLLLLLGLWRSSAPDTRFLRWVLGVAAVADALAYGLPPKANTFPGTVEFLCLFLLLVGIAIAAWTQRHNGVWPWLIGACIPLAFAGMALVQYWPHGALLAVAVACCLLSWVPGSHDPPLPRRAPQATAVLTNDALPILPRILRAALFALVGVASFTHWVVTDPSFDGPINTAWPRVLGFSALLLTLAAALPVYGRMIGGRWVLRLSLVAGAGAALASVGNIFEDGLQMGWVFFVVILGTAIIDLALLALTFVIARTGRGGQRLLALIPAATVAAIIFFVWAGGVIMLVTWLAAAAVALALRTSAAALAARATT